MNNNIPRFKILLVGDGGVGKTVFMKRHTSGEFIREYNATVGVVVRPLKFFTNHGPIIFNVWDCAGQERFGGLRDGYYIRGDGSIIMFDVTYKPSFDHVGSWYRDVKRVCDNIPIVFAGNKVDVVPHQNVKEKHFVTNEMRNQLRHHPLPFQQQKQNNNNNNNNNQEEKDNILNLPTITYFDISAKSNFNFAKPFLFLARALTGVQGLYFVKQPKIINTMNNPLLTMVPQKTEFEDDDGKEDEQLIRLRKDDDDDDDDNEKQSSSSSWSFDLIDDPKKPKKKKKMNLLVQKCDFLLKEKRKNKKGVGKTSSSCFSENIEEVDISASIFMSEVVRVTVQKLVDVVVGIVVKEEEEEEESKKKNMIEVEHFQEAMKKDKELKSQTSVTIIGELSGDNDDILQDLPSVEEGPTE